jgi:hypothetical protein
LNVLPVTVTSIVVTVFATPLKRTESSPPVVLTAPKSTWSRVASSAPEALLSTVKLPFMPPLMSLVATETVPNRSVNLALPSSNGDRPFVPFVPLMTLSATVRPVTWLPRMP